jgi:hypothetical protein
MKCLDCGAKLKIKMHRMEVDDAEPAAPPPSVLGDGDGGGASSLLPPEDEAAAPAPAAEESLEAKVTRRVQERAADYKASAFTLRDILDELSDELGCDVRAAGLKELVKKVLVHALDALENESQ